MNENASTVPTQPLDAWLADQREKPAIISTLNALAGAAIAIAWAVRQAPVDGNMGAIDQHNVQGEQQKKLDVIADEIMITTLNQVPDIAVMVSEEVAEPIINPNSKQGADFAVCFDPLDGSSNIEVNGTIGTIFSVLRLEGEQEDSQNPVEVSDIIAAVPRQLAAGYFLYGPSTLLVLTTGKSVNMFALNAAGDAFVLVREGLTIPVAATEFSINVAHRRFWEQAVSDYIDECLLGEEGPRGKRFNMRWAGSMVADVHRLFLRGGIFIYPALATPNGANGKLRFLYEANPMAMLVAAAGGSAISGGDPIAQVQARDIHQRVPLALGSREEVDQLAKKYR